jgi:AhpD family alkylhydroperoxidase
MSPIWIVTSLILLGAMVPVPAHAQSSAAARAAMEDIQATLGSVPTFFKLFPEEALPSAWATMKTLQLSPNTAIPGKYKELIGLGVAAQIPCHYCVYFHTEAARLNGASDREINEALAAAGLSRYMSTVVNGFGQDQAEFRAEIQKALAHMKKMGDQAPPSIEVVDAESAYKDITAVFGFVPTFLKGVPASILPSTWNELKSLEFNPHTAIPNKYKSLLSLAVASQVPCDYCVYADKEFTKLEGSTDQEIAEAIAMAAITRHWSTFLNGSGLDMSAFRKEADAIMAHARSTMTAKK